MCGRFTQKANADEIAREFDLESVPELSPRYNIAPTQPVLAVRLSPSTGKREAVFLTWGLIPRWAKDSKIGHKLINARTETVAIKPSFRDAFKHRHCLIPTTGFYEWKKEGSRKQPYFIGRDDGKPFAFAGLWERWEPKGGEPVESCTILTTEANNVVRPIHERMPVIVPQGSYAEWLVPRSTTSVDSLPTGERPEARLLAYPVTTSVNSPSVDQPTCIEPMPRPQASS